MKVFITVVKPIVIGLVAGVLIYTVGSAVDAKQDQHNDKKEYCSMVALNIDSGGKLGWPDYRGVYLKECPNE